MFVNECGKNITFFETISIYDKLCQTCIGVAPADPQIFGGDINVGSERSERPISHTAFEFKKSHERSEYIDLNWPKGKVGGVPSLSACPLRLLCSGAILVYIILFIPKSRGEAVAVSG